MLLNQDVGATNGSEKKAAFPVMLVCPPLEPTGRRSLPPRHPPHMLAYAAATLREAGFQVGILDGMLEAAPLEDLVQRIRRWSPRLVGVAVADLVRVVPPRMVDQFCRALRGALDGIPIVLLGHRLPRVLEERLEVDGAAHYALVGDPELPLLALAERLRDGGDLRGLPGLVRREGGDVLGAAPYQLPDLDQLPFPAWELVALERYALRPHRYRTSAVYPVLASRGCPWNQCMFCKDYSLAKLERYSAREPGRVVEEVVHDVVVHGATEIFFVDGHFPMDREWVVPFCAELAARAPGIPWACLARADSFTPGVLEAMKRAGCWGIFCGLEAGDQELLDAINKGARLEDLARGVQMAHEAGIAVNGNFLIGIPGETPLRTLKTIRFARGLPLESAAFFLVKYRELTPELAARGRLSEEWELAGHDFAGRAYIPDGYGSLPALRAIQRLAYLAFYARPGYILKQLRRVRDTADLRRMLSGVGTLAKILVPPEE